MLAKILHPDVQQFIVNNADKDATKLLLKGGEIAGVAITQIVEQIISRNKAKDKIPFLYTTQNVIFPPKLSMEQCSSEKTAGYKSNLVVGNHGADLTGGAGVDTYFLSKKFKHFDYVEQNGELAQLTAHNFSRLNAENITTHECSAEDFLNKTKTEFDLIYLDPARRDDNNKKVFLFADCTPNIVTLKDKLFKKSTRVMVKASPLVDIKMGIRELGNVEEVHVIAVNNECKELLFLLSKGYEGNAKIVAVNEKNGWNKFEFFLNEEANCEAQFSIPQNYLYEPNVALLKSGAYKSISNRFNINKLNINSHLYTSKTPIENFPGRTFKIDQVLKYDKKTIVKTIPSKKANITVRNFPETVHQIRKKTGLKEGGDNYLFATTDKDNKKILILANRC